MLPADPGRFRLEIFDDEAVLFDTLSGDTHHLGPLALARLQGMTTDAIRARFETEAGQPLDAVIAEVEGQLRDWGLIA